MPNIPNIGGLFVPGGTGGATSTKSSGVTSAKVLGPTKPKQGKTARSRSAAGMAKKPQSYAPFASGAKRVGGIGVNPNGVNGSGAAGGGGGSYGGYSGGSMDVSGTGSYGGVSGGAAEAPKSIYDMTTSEQDELIKPDQIYNNEVTAYQNALNALLADLDLEKGETERGYTKNLTDLGWLGDGQGFNGWDVGNLNTAFGNAYTNNENDFAARGMYDSSARAEALVRMLDDFSDQRTGMATAQDATLKDISNRRAAGETTKNDSVAMARQNALARYAASLGVI